MTTPDFSRYSEAQLRQVLTRIDAAKYPDRVREIEARLAAQATIAPAPPAAADVDDADRGPITVAGPLRRSFAFVIDMLLLAALGWSAGWFLHDQFAALGVYGRAVGLIVSVAYFSIMESRIGNGQSVGKRVARLRVVDKRGAPLGVPAVLGRSLVFCFICWFLNGAPLLLGDSNQGGAIVQSTLTFGALFCIPYLVVFNRRTRQSLHDLAAGALVVHAGTGPLVLPTQPVWRGHAAVMGAAVAAILAGLLAMSSHVSEDLPMASYEKTVHALAGVPGIGRPAIGLVTLRTAGSSIGILSIQVPVAPSTPQTAALALRVAAAALANIPAANRQHHIDIMFRSGYDIGIARAWTTSQFTGTPEEWRDWLAAPKK